MLCLVDALHFWVGSCDDPTYDDVVEALMGKIVANTSLAKQIAKKYNVALVAGKQTVE